MPLDPSRPSMGYTIFPDFCCITMVCILPSDQRSHQGWDPHVPAREQGWLSSSITNVFLQCTFNYVSTRFLQALPHPGSVRYAEETGKVFQISGSPSALPVALPGSLMRSWGWAVTSFPVWPLHHGGLSPDLRAKRSWRTGPCVLAVWGHLPRSRLVGGGRLQRKHGPLMVSTSELDTETANAKHSQYQHTNPLWIMFCLFLFLPFPLKTRHWI